MKIISVIERSQREVIERILRQCGLWEGPIRTRASPRAPLTVAGAWTRALRHRPLSV